MGTSSTLNATFVTSGVCPAARRPTLKAIRLPTANVDSCEYHSIVVEADTQGGPEPILLAQIADDLELPPIVDSESAPLGAQ